MTMYTTLKLLHVSAAMLTIGGFVLRGYWLLRRPRLLQSRSVRVVPHIVDTVFLLSGVALILILHLQLAQNGWLLIKLAALPLYIVLGTIALHRGRTPAARWTSFVLALLTFAYIAGVALSTSAASWLAFIL
ncbi:MAG: SirB2 family protein [Gammaproteobacteria bacterium]|nr:MAG: SirB2 family protein [Gammaproteobacteria bacterium]